RGGSVVGGEGGCARQRRVPRRAPVGEPAGRCARERFRRTRRGDRAGAARAGLRRLGGRTGAHPRLGAGPPPAPPRTSRGGDAQRTASDVANAASCSLPRDGGDASTNTGTARPPANEVEM